MTDVEIKKIIKDTISNGLMDKVKLAVIDALNPLIIKMNDHADRIKSLEVQGGKCEQHDCMMNKINKANFNTWIVHVQWFAITVLVGIVAWILK